MEFVRNGRAFAFGKGRTNFRWSGNANVVSALIKAGAVEVLLKAGADPKMKDKKGRTALAIAQKSNAVGSEEVVNLLKTLTK